MSGWKYHSKGFKGPVSDQELQRLIIDGTLDAYSFVWKEGMRTWKQVKQVPSLAHLLPVQEPRSKIPSPTEALQQQPKAQPKSLPEPTAHGANKETKEWLEFAVFIAVGAAFLAGISALFNGQFAVQWLYCAVALTILPASIVGSMLLFEKWRMSPALGLVVGIFFTAPACLAIAFAVLDSLLGR